MEIMSETLTDVPEFSQTTITVDHETRILIKDEQEKSSLTATTVAESKPSSFPKENIAPDSTANPPVIQGNTVVSNKKLACRQVSSLSNDSNLEDVNQKPSAKKTHDNAANHEKSTRWKPPQQSSPSNTSEIVPRWKPPSQAVNNVNKASKESTSDEIYACMIVLPKWLHPTRNEKERLFREFI
jgi:hypothetical protein